MKMSEVRLRGRGFTLYPAARELNVDEELANVLLIAIYQQIGIIDKAEFVTDEGFEIEEKDPDMPEKIEAGFIEGEVLSKVKEVGLLDENLNITELFKSVLKKAADNQKYLDEEHFSFCPCVHAAD